MPDDASPPLAELSDGLHRPLRLGPDAAAHERPWRGRPGPALAVALPGNLEEVRHVVRWARRHGVRVLPQGAVTGLVGASTPPPEGPALLVLSTEALTGRLEIDPLSATAVVSAGVRLSSLDSAAAAHGLELPIDLAADPSLGAMVATNTGGSRVLRYGDMSTHVLGVQAVVADADISVIGSLRGLRKDNTGPDPTRMLLGSAGALGVITAVCVALSPRAQTRATAWIGPIDDVAAVELLGDMRGSLGGELSAFEVLCPRAASAARRHLENPPPVEIGADPQVNVLVEASGSAGTEDRLVDAVLTSSHGDTGVLVPPERAWAMRHAVTAALAAEGTVVGFDLSVAPSVLPLLRREVRSLVAQHAPDWKVADFGHWGDGGVHCNLLVESPLPFDAALAASVRIRIYELVDRLGGSYSAEHGIGPLNADWWRRRTPPAQQRLVAAFKQQVDPLGVLGHPGIPFA